MARLKPWYQVVTPREDLRENRPLDASEFAVHLDHESLKKLLDRLGKAIIMFEQLGSAELEVPVTTDTAGKKDAHAVRPDKKAPEAIRKSNLHREVASAIFFESNGGMSRSKAEATPPEIKTGVADPDLNLVDVDHVWEGLVGSCFCLNWDRNRYRFGLTPNRTEGIGFV